MCLGPNRPGPSNVESRLDASGLRVAVTVADRLCFAHADDITLELRAQNTTSEVIHFDSAPQGHFRIEPAGGGTPAWVDSDCSARSRVPGDEAPHVAAEVQPGETVTIAQTVYPGP